MSFSFDVLKYRLENEYKVEIRLENLPYEYIRGLKIRDHMNLWSETSDMKKIKGSQKTDRCFSLHMSGASG